MFANRSLLRSLLLRLCQTYKSSLSNSVSASSGGSAESAEGQEVTAVTSTPLKADAESGSLDVKAVSILGVSEEGRFGWRVG